MVPKYSHIIFIMFFGIIFSGGFANAKLLHCWSFNGDPNGTAAWADLVGNANAIPMGHATIKNNVLDLTANDGVNEDPCKVGASWVELPIQNSLEALESTFTVECWFRWPNQMVGQYRIWDFGSSDSSICLGTNQDASVLHACLHVGGEKPKRVLMGGYSPRSPQWQHSVFTYNVTRGIAEHYINGILIRQQKIPDGLTPHNVVFKNSYLGRCSVLPMHPMWDGLIDEIRIYDHAMLPSEVQYSYKRGPDCLIASQMTQSIRNADYKFSLKQYKDAEAILDAQIEAYSKWYVKHPLDEVYPEDKLPIIYYKLAKAEEMLGEPNEKILKSYTQVFSSSNPNYSQEQADALLWLLHNGHKKEFAAVIGKEADKGVSNNSFKSVICNVCQYLATNDNWSEMEQLVKSVASGRNGLDWCLFIDTLNLKNEKWKANYRQYFESHLVGNSVFYAEKAARSGNMADAVASYTDFLTRFGHTCDTNEIELKLCKCLFENREYGKTVKQIEAFLAQKQATAPRTIVKNAMLLNARAYIQLGELDKARNMFLTLMIVYQEAEESPEISYLLGYCYMLQQKFSLAEDAFTFLIKEHRGSAYAKKAAATMSRMHGMSEPDNKL